MQLTGAEIVIEVLKEQGVDTVFGYPGGSILNIYDALYKHSNEIHLMSRVRHMLQTDMQGRPVRLESVWQHPDLERQIL